MEHSSTLRRLDIDQILQHIVNLISILSIPFLVPKSLQTQLLEENDCHKALEGSKTYLDDNAV